MYLTPLKTVLREAVKDTFTANYPVANLKNMFVSIEFPVKQTEYPSIWVDYESEGDIQNIGINYHESTLVDGVLTTLERWRLQGYAVYTILALTSLERDLIFDELVKITAFGKENAATAPFRTYIENNEYLGLNMNFDRMSPGQPSAMPGTPWGTDEYIYEMSLRIQLVGEFLSDGTTITPAIISKIIAEPRTIP